MEATSCNSVPFYFAIDTDTSYSLPAIRKYHETWKDNNFKNPEFYIMDAAYDAVETYSEIKGDYNNPY